MNGILDGFARGVVATAVVAGFLTSGWAQSPNDLGGVGAQGKIGRGTSPGEHPGALDMPFIRYTQVYVATPEEAAPAMRPAEPSEPSAPIATPPPAEPVSRVRRVPALVRNNPYMTFHRGWVHGYWNTAASQPAERAPQPTAASESGGFGAASATLPEPGMGLGWGLPAWLVGPMVYDWGYSPFLNPYLAERPAGAAQPAPYASPIPALSAPPTATLVDEALRDFLAAREAFRREDYSEALRQVDAALVLMPGDPSIQEFRGLTLMAMRRYREAAEVLHSVVAVVPGWDWLTMTRLYRDTDVFTRQLRDVEAFTVENPRSAAGHFLLAYLYLTTGYADDAAAQLDEVVAQSPNDSLAGGLVRALRARKRDASAPAGRRGSGSGDLAGRWIARPRSDTTITLEVRPDGRLVWKVAASGRAREYDGFASYFDDILALTQDLDNAMAARVVWTDPRHFRLRLLEGQEGDPGLAFERSP
ncbi:MAG: tetratricopeptide repeat protein [Isosphaeraceae bacterium]